MLEKLSEHYRVAALNTRDPSGTHQSGYLVSADVITGTLTGLHLRGAECLSAHGQVEDALHHLIAGQGLPGGG